MLKGAGGWWRSLSSFKRLHETTRDRMMDLEYTKSMGFGIHKKHGIILRLAVSSDSSVVLRPVS